MDWNENDPVCIGTSSIDTTCTIWDIPKEKVKTQLIAHDKEVYDISFSQEQHTFASAGADGSVRLFDLRNLDQSTIIFENPEQTPFMRVSWNQKDTNFLATINLNQKSVFILDIRYFLNIRFPMLSVAELMGHIDNVNCIGWSPESIYMIASGGEDNQTHIFDLSKSTNAGNPVHQETSMIVTRPN
jgi:WD repeat-containing protein 68